MTWYPLAIRRRRKPATPESMKWALELGFIPLTVNRLHENGITTLDIFRRKTSRELLAIPNMSQTQLRRAKRLMGKGVSDDLDLPLWAPESSDDN